MVRHLQSFLAFAATAGVASMLAGAAPAVAADVSMSGGQAAAKALPSKEPHHALRGSLRYARQVERSNAVPNCAGVWCGRQFVLMVGIAY